jgi:hypothetical protein
MELEVLKGLVTLPKSSTQPPLTQTPEPTKAPEKKKRGRKPKSLMTFTVSRGDFVVEFN